MNYYLYYLYFRNVCVKREENRSAICRFRIRLGMRFKLSCLTNAFIHLWNYRAWNMCTIVSQMLIDIKYYMWLLKTHNPFYVKIYVKQWEKLFFWMRDYSFLHQTEIQSAIKRVKTTFYSCIRRSQFRFYILRSDIGENHFPRLRLVKYLPRLRPRA